MRAVALSFLPETKENRSLKSLLSILYSLIQCMLFRTSNTKDGKSKLGTSEVLCRAKILAVKMII